MKKILCLLLLAACSEDEPVFKIDPFLQSRFDKFVEIAADFDVVIPKNNLILSFATDENIDINDSRVYKDGDQLHIDIDQKFTELHAQSESHLQFVLFQIFANGMLGTPYRDCGLMNQVLTPTDIPVDPQMDYGTYPNLFDSASPCLD